MSTLPTPGPWSIHPVTGNVVGASPGPGRCLRSVCRTPQTYPEDQANAQLIAQAPDLLAELEAMTHSVPMKGENGITWYAIPDQRMASARAVVLRAKGGAS